MRAAVYARLSIDDGRKEGTERQVADCEAYAALKEWVVVDRYVDRDTSAYDRRVRRPEWERLIADAEAGMFDVVVAWKLDRLCRRVSDFTRFWDVCEPRGVALASVTESIDSSTPLGQTMITILVSFAQLESATISTRTRRAKQSAAAKGKPKHGGYRGFGHDRDGGIVAAEAAAIREAADKLISGASLSSVAREWRDTGIRTPTGRAWPTPHLRRLLLQPRLAGARRLADGELVATGEIEPILTDDEHRVLSAILTDPARRTNRGRVHDLLLPGLLHCALCGARMETHAVRGKRTYQCYGRPEQAACGKVAVTASRADEHVEGVVLDLVDTPEMRAALAAPTDDPSAVLADQLAADEAQLEAVDHAHYVARTLSSRRYERIRGELEGRIAAARGILDRHASRRAIPLAALPDLRHDWPTLPIDTRRAVTRAVISRVDCEPAKRRGPWWDPSRLKVTLAIPGAEQPDDAIERLAV